MNQQNRLSQPRYTLALLAALAAATCAKAEDKAADGSSGAGGSGGGVTGNSAMGTSANNTTTISTASAATATAAAATTSGATTSAAAGSSTTTSGGGTQGGEAGAPGDTSSANDSTSGGGNGGAGTEGSVSTTGVPPDVIENAEVVLLYKVDSTDETTNSIFMHLYLRNQSDDAFPLNAAEVRYWLDPDGLNFTMASHYQGPGIGAVTLSKGSDGDDDYVAVTFAKASLAGNTTDINANEFQVKLDAAGGNFDQSNDYSFAAITSMTEHDRITVYLADELIWGCEPSGRCAGDDPGAGGAAGAAGAEG